MVATVNTFTARGTLADRPAAGTRGNSYFAQDDTTGSEWGTSWIDDGTAWVAITDLPAFLDVINLELILHEAAADEQ
jgi:hypothetical protein